MVLMGVMVWEQETRDFKLCLELIAVVEMGRESSGKHWGERRLQISLGARSWSQALRGETLPDRGRVRFQTTLKRTETSN